MSVRLTLTSKNELSICSQVFRALALHKLIYLENMSDKKKSSRKKGSPKSPRKTPSRASSEQPAQRPLNTEKFPITKNRKRSQSYSINNSPFSNTPLAQFLSTFKPSSSQWVAKYVFVPFALIFRAAIGLGPYSGYKSEPMRGDFEAQRHWMEVTNHLPLCEWYFHELEWWGLDYPPLTAYHSWLLGKVGIIFGNVEWFQLYTSRGLDDYDLKSYMRGTVIFSELAVYIPAVIMFVRWYGKYVSRISAIDQSIAASAILFQPALMLIDHGHFQYNSVMLGLTLLAIVNLNYNNRLIASFLFVLSLCFKQMALYYAPIFLRICWAAVFLLA